MITEFTLLSFFTTMKVVVPITFCASRKCLLVTKTIKKENYVS